MNTGIVLPALLLAFIAIVWAFVLQIAGIELPRPQWPQKACEWIGAQMSVVLTAPVRLHVFGSLTFDDEAIEKTRSITVKLSIGGKKPRTITASVQHRHATGKFTVDDVRLHSNAPTLADVERHSDLMARLRTKYPVATVAPVVQPPRASVSYDKLWALPSPAGASHA